LFEPGKYLFKDTACPPTYVPASPVEAHLVSPRSY
jgi:hypothetical protein